MAYERWRLTCLFCSYFDGTHYSLNANIRIMSGNRAPLTYDHSNTEIQYP
jgi:hypothetical protein